MLDKCKHLTSHAYSAVVCTCIGQTKHIELVFCFVWSLCYLGTHTHTHTHTHTLNNGTFVHVLIDNIGNISDIGNSRNNQSK